MRETLFQGCPLDFGSLVLPPTSLPLVDVILIPVSICMCCGPINVSLCPIFPSTRTWPYWIRATIIQLGSFESQPRRLFQIKLHPEVWGPHCVFMGAQFSVFSTFLGSKGVVLPHSFPPAHLIFRISEGETFAISIQGRMKLKCERELKIWFIVRLRKERSAECRTT